MYNNKNKCALYSTVPTYLKKVPEVYQKFNSTRQLPNLGEYPETISPSFSKIHNWAENMAIIYLNIGTVQDFLKLNLNSNKGIKY